MTKPLSAWQPDQPGTIAQTNLGVLRVTQDGTQRITQANSNRILNDNVFTPKERSAWS